jgi:hypothetical protein
MHTTTQDGVARRLWKMAWTTARATGEPVTMFTGAVRTAQRARVMAVPSGNARGAVHRTMPSYRDRAVASLTTARFWRPSTPQEIVKALAYRECLRLARELRPIAVRVLP